MSESDLSAAYYGAVKPTNAVEMPVKGSNEIVTVDFMSEVPEAEEILTFLENEEVPVPFWLEIATNYTAKGLQDQADVIITKALEVFRNDEAQVSRVKAFVAWTGIRRAREATSQSERAQTLFMALENIKHLGSYPLAALAKAEALYLQNHDGEAIRALDALKSIKGQLPAYAQLITAKIHFRRGKINDALRHFQAVLVEQPLIKPDPRLGVGLCFWALKDHKFAIQSWERALQIDPQNTTAQLLLSLAKFDTSFKALSDEEFTRDYTVALDSLNQLLKKTSTSPAALIMRASYHFSLGEFDTVSSISESLLTSNFNSSVVHSEAHFWLGRVSYAQAQFKDAQKHFKDATDLNSDSITAHLGYAQSLASRGELQDAIISLETLSKKYGKLPEIQYTLGQLYAQRFEGSHESEDSTRAISALQEYIKLAQQNSEPVAVTAYLTLSRFHEGSDNIEALKYIEKAVQVFQAHGEEAPAELVSNWGVMHFVQGSTASAQTFFKTALEASTDDEIAVTLNYNLARADEDELESTSMEKYNSILEKVPGYSAAKMRSLFLQLMKSSSGPEFDAEIDELLAQDPENLEVRAFYSWYLKKTGRGSHEGLENTHNKETLTKYNSRDTYALISLANMYRSIAREMRPKNEKDAEKRKTSYHRAAQLFHKALSTDPRNAFAAQGIAIVFAEEKKPAQALEIFRRVRDAVDSFSVHINLGHCLSELDQHAKAIQEYSIALTRFSDESKDAKTLGLIGKAWFARGAQEKSLESYAKALEFSKKALSAAKEHQTRLLQQMQYNVAFVQFSIAQFLVRLEKSKRTVDDITDALEGLKEAVDAFTSLAEDPKHAPVSPEILTQRASMGSNTLTTQLERIFKEQEEFEVQFKAKIEEAKRIREVERTKAELEEQKRKAEQDEKEKKMREEFEMLQEQAKQWEAERESLIVAEDEDKPRRKKKNAVWTDEEASADENGEKKPKTKKKRTKKKVTDEDGEEKPVKQKKRKLTKREEKYKSQETIEDSDEEVGDYDESTALEQAEAKLDKDDEDDDEDEDEVLF